MRECLIISSMLVMAMALSSVALAQQKPHLPSAHQAPVLTVWASKHQPLLSPEQLNAVEEGSFTVSKSVPDRDANQQSCDRSIRVATWNIERGLQYEKIVGAIKQEVAADIYLLQEVDCYTRRTSYKDVARKLAEDLGMYYVFGIEFQELAQEGSGQPALHGQTILSRFPITWARVLRFVHQPKDWSHDWFQPRHGGRMALVAEIQAPARKLVVYDAHLESRGDEKGRASQMQEIVFDIVDNGYSEPILIAGDLNTKKEDASPVIEVAHHTGFADVPVGSNGRSATSGNRHLDWILTKGLVPISATIHTRVEASDHKPVSAKLEFQGRREIYPHR